LKISWSTGARKHQPREEHRATGPEHGQCGHAAPQLQARDQVEDGGDGAGGYRQRRDQTHENAPELRALARAVQAKASRQMATMTLEQQPSRPQRTQFLLPGAISADRGLKADEDRRIQRQEREGRLDERE